MRPAEAVPASFAPATGSILCLSVSAHSLRKCKDAEWEDALVQAIFRFSFKFPLLG